MQKFGSRTYNSAHAKLAMLSQHHMNMVKVLWYLNICSWGLFKDNFHFLDILTQLTYSQAFRWYNFFDILCSTSSCRQSVASFLITYRISNYWQKISSPADSGNFTCISQHHFPLLSHSLLWIWHLYTHQIHQSTMQNMPAFKHKWYQADRGPFYYIFVDSSCL